jgi:hypothetical protein
MGHAAHHDCIQAASALAADIPRRTGQALHSTLLRCLRAYVPLPGSFVARAGL